MFSVASYGKAVGKLVFLKQLCSSLYGVNASRALNDIEYDRLSNRTLESLYDCLDALSDVVSNLPAEYDVSLSNGVLTVKLGQDIGTYVINKQTPNKQIWLSSPISGPKRYDYVDNQWVYLHDQVPLHQLLETELKNTFKCNLIRLPKHFSISTDQTERY
ncbi:unnamed protein product [Soboliphyme baturini]|uniref:ferroxidase n=1 Tax=Soboliphyme baturini TaxID=241478 RepID=A0A183J6H9_9BILA|nr:unnamed protein product [Soboliphyme baturini]